MNRYHYRKPANHSMIGWFSDNDRYTYNYDQLCDNGTFFGWIYCGFGHTIFD